MSLASVQMDGPSWLVRGRANTVTLPLFNDGVPDGPSAGTYTLVDESDTELVSAAAVDVSTGVASYTIGAGVLPTTLPFSWYYREFWELDGVPFERAAHLVRRVPTITVTPEDLYQRQEVCRRLTPTSTPALIPGAIAGSWGIIMRRLMQLGTRPPRLLDSWQLKEWHINLALFTLFNGAGAAYRTQAEDYYRLANSEESRLQLALDFDDSGATTPDEEGEGVYAPIILTSGRLRR